MLLVACSLLFLVNVLALRHPSKTNVCIVGGGAAGYMAAINCGKILKGGRSSGG